MVCQSSPILVWDMKAQDCSKKGKIYDLVFLLCVVYLLMLLLLLLSNRKIEPYIAATFP